MISLLIREKFGHRPARREGSVEMGMGVGGRGCVAAGAGIGGYSCGQGTPRAAGHQELGEAREGFTQSPRGNEALPTP